jgi:hypothetical protein
METARAGCVAVSTVLALCLLFANGLAAANKTVPALLLFLPGLLATLAFRPAAHALTSRVLSLVRFGTLACAAAAFLAAFALVAVPVQTVDRGGDGAFRHLTFSRSLRDADTAPRRSSSERSSANSQRSRPIYLNGTANITFANSRATDEEPSVAWLRYCWAPLLVLALAATGLVCVATQRARP